MPNAASLKLNGIKGTGQIKGREGDVTVVGFRHEVKNDIDPRTGTPTKDRTHTPLVILKNLDFSTAALHAAHADGRTFSTFELKLYHMPRSGNEHNYFIIKLDNAKIASMKLVMPDVALDMHSIVHEYEEVEFTYDSITYTTPDPPPAPSLDAGSYGPYSTTDSGTSGLVTGSGVKFAPDWIEEGAEAQVKKMYEAVKEAAQKKFEEDLKKAKETPK